MQSLNIDESCIENISRQNIESKSKNLINYIEISIDAFDNVNYGFDEIKMPFIEKKLYCPISDYPSSIRDLSFAIKDYSKSESLQKLLLNFHHEILKEVFIFDYYVNEKHEEIKIGFRFVFQSLDSTITDFQVSEVMNDIIKESLKFDTVSIPGLL